VDGISKAFNVFATHMQVKKNDIYVEQGNGRDLINISLGMVNTLW